MLELANKIAEDFKAATTAAKIELAGIVLVVVVVLLAIF